MAALDKLPSEVITDIIDLLDYHTLSNIRLTSQLFASFISPKRLSLAFIITKLRLLYSECQHSARLENVISWNPIIRTYNHQIAALLRPQFNDRDCRSVAHRAFRSLELRVGAELCPMSDMPDHLPCYCCLKHVPRSNFVRSQKRNKRAFGHQNCIYRVCNDCVTRKKRWAKDDPVNTGRVCFRMCERCNKVEEMQRAAPGKGRKKPLHVCDRCHTSRHNGWNARNAPGSVYRQGLGTGDSRCQRCWYLRDEERPAKHEREGRLMCSECFDIATRVKGPDVMSEGMEWLTKTMSRVEVNDF